MKGGRLHRLVVLALGHLGLLALVFGHGHDIMQQQHCEPVIRR